MTSIAISGLPGSGSTTVARSLAAQLNIPYFSAGQLFKDIAQGVLATQHYYPFFKQLCDKRSLTLPRFAFSKAHASVDLWKTEFGANPLFHQAIEALQQELVNAGPIVIDGKLSIHMLKDVTLRVWLSGNLEARAARTAQRDAISQKEAAQLLIQREELHKKEWFAIYGFDYLEQEHEADLIIDTSHKSPAQIVEEILHVLTSARTS